MHPGSAQDPAFIEWDIISEKLYQIGCSFHKVGGRKPKPIQFSDSEVESMAEMEHGRWVVKRLQDGWKWTAERNIPKEPNNFSPPTYFLLAETLRELVSFDIKHLF
jgi:hypothetical protein